MNQIKPASSRQSLRCYALTVLLVLCACGLSPEAARGQWTTNSNNSDINNTNTGNVGIGATAPTEKLVTTGNALFGGATARTELWENFTPGTNPALFEINSGETVSSDTRFAALSLVTKQAGASNAIGGIYFSNSFITAYDKRLAAIGSGTDGGVNSGVLAFSTANAGSLIERLRITAAGNVGIGTYTPGAKLTVRDDAGVNGNRYLLNLNRDRCANASTGNGISFSDWGANAQASILALRHNCNANYFTDLIFSVNAGAWGSDPDTTLTEVMRVGASRRVGIGTNNAQSRLHVNGSEATEWIRIQSTAAGTAGTFDMYTSGTGGFLAGTSGFNTSSAASPIAFALGGAEVMRVTNGSLGIGTPTPTAKLDVQGGQINASGGLCMAGDCRTAWSNVSPWAASGANLNYNTGNVGIGTANPIGKLEVSGSGIGTLGGFFAVTNRAAAAVNNAARVGFDLLGFDDATPTAAIDGLLTNTNGASSLVFNTYDGSGSIANNYERMRITGSGNVGIGTATPNHKLDVNGEINATGLRINGAPVTGSQWTTNDSNAYFNTGNVGIGTTNPTSKLDVIQANATSIRALSGNEGAHTAIQLGRIFAETSLGIAAGPGHYAVDAVAGDVILRTESPSQKLLFSNGPGSSTLAVANVGVSVTGSMNVTGTITGGVIEAKYQDVAEWVPSSQKLEAGTVVALDPEKSNHVLASSQAYDMSVAGVVSAQPGITLGEGGEGKVLVATTGRVKVKVDASRAPIKIGDLLVTSDVAGVAMKSEPVSIGGRRMHSPGTLIGKALEPLASGTGVILVLLSLQ